MSCRRTLISFLLVAFVASLLMPQLPEAASRAAQAEKPERKLWQHIPQHLPVKLKIKNLHSEKFLRDLEVEAKNVSGKPIYFLHFGLSFPDVVYDDGYPIGYGLRYGRMDLIDFNEPIKPSDVPIMPGETVILRIPQKYVEGWEMFSSRKKLPKSEPKKVEIIFQQINFGDGTGYSGTGATPIPNRRSSKGGCGVQNGKRAAVGRFQPDPPLDPAATFSTIFVPANFSPVNFFPATGNRIARTEAGSDDAWLALDRDGNGTINVGL